MTASTPLPTMFIPIASPVVRPKRRYACRPASATWHPWSLPKREVRPKTPRSSSSDSGASTNALSAAAIGRSAQRSTGARVIPSPSTADTAPPALAIARAPRLVDATSAPSVVASGTVNRRPSRRSGPTTPTGMVMKPTTFSQLVPCTEL